MKAAIAQDRDDVLVARHRVAELVLGDPVVLAGLGEDCLLFGPSHAEQVHFRQVEFVDAGVPMILQPSDASERMSR